MIPYIGGKCVLSKWIIENFPENYQSMQYCEVFGGGGWVLFKKDRSYLETYNDKDENLVNLFRIIRDNYEEFHHLTNWTLHSRAECAAAKLKLKSGSANKIGRALYYSISRSQTFSGKGGFGYQIRAGKKASGMWTPFVKRLPAIRERLEGVQIECLDFRELIKKYDDSNTIFYLDPPYVDAEFYYSVPFTRKDHEDLADLLKQIKGKFVLSYYDNPLVREYYKGYNILTRTTTKSSAGMTRYTGAKERPAGHELLIKNY